VQVTLTLKATNTDHDTTTDQTGYYSFPSVPIGDYLMTADLSGEAAMEPLW
jgi:Carboxypeptidase regulatory-like domain